MLRTVFRQGSLYLATLLFARLVNFLALPVYARTFAPDEFGAYELVTLFAGLAGIVIVLEVSQGVARFYPEAATDEQRRAYASAAFWFTLCSYSTFCAVSAIAAGPFAGWLLDTPDRAGVFRVALLSIWSNGICYLLQNQLRWRLLARHYAISAATVTLLSQGSAIFLILVFDLGLEGLFLGSFFGGVAGSTVAYYFCRGDIVARVDWSRLGVMLRFALPLAVSGLVMFAGRNSDRYMIKELMSLEDVGMYGVAGRLAALASIFLAGFQSALLPLVTTFSKEARTPEDLARILRYFLACALPAVLVLAAYSREIMLLIAGQRYAAAHSLIPLLAAGILLSGMYVFAPGLWLARRTGWMLWINLVTAALAIGLNLAFIPLWGILGAALATLTAGLANFLGFFVANQLTYHLPVPYGRLLLAAGLCALLSAGASQLLAPDAHAARAALVAAALMAVTAPLLAPAEAMRLLKQALAEVRHRMNAR